MTAYAQFDASSGDATATVNVAASTGYTVDVVLRAPAASLAAVLAGQGGSTAFTAFFLWLGSTSQGDGIDAFYPPGGPWQLQANTFVSGALVADTATTLRAVVTHSSGTLWDIVWKQDGTTLGTDTGVDFGTDQTQPMEVTIGALFNTGTSGEVYRIDSVSVQNVSSATIFSDDFASGDFSSWDSTSGAATVVGGGGGGADAGGAGGVRIGIAFDDTTFETSPTWTYITALDDVRAASYSKDCGKQDEEDQVGTTQVVVNVFDRNGVLDPTNSDSPYYGLIQPLLQLQIELWNPCAAEWQTRFRGFVSDWDYVPYAGRAVDPAGVVDGYTSLQISGVGVMEPLSAIQMQLGAFGDTPPAGTEGNVFFDNATFQDRISQVMGNAGIPDEWFVAFTGNVEMAESRYAPTDNVMSVIQDTVDAELPTVANAYEDRFGRLAAHGRLAEFDPSGTWTSIAGTDAGRDAVWRYRDWKLGDGTAVAASPSDTAHIRSFAFNRGLDRIHNSAYCTPNVIAQADKAGQLSTDPTSIGQYGIRSWSKEGLYISAGLLTGNTALQETKKYADFVVANYKDPHNRVTQLTVKAMRPDDPRAAATWAFLCECDIQDSAEVTIAFTGRPADSPNFNLEPFFIQGIHEQVSPLDADYAMVETSLDLSPRPLETAGLDIPAS